MCLINNLDCTRSSKNVEALRDYRLITLWDKSGNTEAPGLAGAPQEAKTGSCESRPVTPETKPNRKSILKTCKVAQLLEKWIFLKTKVKKTQVEPLLLGSDRAPVLIPNWRHRGEPSVPKPSHWVTFTAIPFLLSVESLYSYLENTLNIERSLLFGFFYC